MNGVGRHGMGWVTRVRQGGQHGVAEFGSKREGNVGWQGGRHGRAE